MRKFNWKALLIAVLALVLVFALVACNDNTEKKPDDKKNPSDNKPTSDYLASQCFGELWDLTKGIGDEEITAGDNVYLNAEIDIELGTKELTTDRKDKSIDLGIALEGIIDRTNEDFRDTQLKLGLYSGTVNIATIYYGFGEPDNIYIDFAGQKILLPLHVQVNADTDNSDLGPWLAGKMGEPILSDKSIRDIITALTGDMGSSWTLDNFVNALLPMFGLDTEEIVAMVASNDLLSAFADIIVKDGKLSIGTALSSTVIDGFFNAKKTGSHYEAYVSSGMIKNMVIGAIGNGDYDEIDLTISFDEENGALKDGVTIDAGIISNTKANDGKLTNGDEDLYPYASVKIKHLRFGNASEEANGHKIAINKSAYSPEAQLNIVEKIALDGIKLNNTALTSLELGVSARLDVDKTHTTIATNKTQAKAYLKYGTDEIITATFVGGRLAVTVNKDVAIGGIKVVELLVKAFGPTLYNWVGTTFFPEDQAPLEQFANVFFTDGTHTAISEDFKGAVWTNINPYGLYQMAIDAIVKMVSAPAAPPATSSADAAPAATFQANKIVDLLYEAFTSIKSLSAGKIEIENSNVLQAVCNIVNTMFGLPIKGGEQAWTVENSLKEVENGIVSLVKGFMTKPGEAEPTDEQVKAEIESQLQEVLTGSNENYIHVAVEGLDLSNKGSDSYLQFVIKAVLGSLKANVLLDLTQGIGWTVKAEFAGASITYTSSINVTAPTTITDPSQGVTATGDGWVLFDMKMA